MIGHLKGQVIALGEEAVIVSVHGTGWKVEANGRTLSRLSVGQPVELWVETLVREDAIRLFGFASDEERAWFVRLQDAQGVGARHALSILDGLSPGEIMDALTLGDAVQFTRARGVGKRLAEKLVLELKGKAPPQGFFSSHASLEQTLGGPPSPSAGASALAAPARGDAIAALIALGYPEAEAARVITGALRELGPGTETPHLIRAGLKALAPS